MTTIDSETIASMARRLERLEAAEAIRDGLYRYCRACDRLDLELLKTCYHPGAADVHWSWIGDATEFADWVLPELAKMRTNIHCITNPLIEWDGDRAFVESQWTVTTTVPLPEEGADTYVEHVSHGRYLDIWDKRNGEWRIAHRHLTDDGGTTQVVRRQPAAPFNPLRTAQPVPADPVYRKFALPDVMPEPTRRPGIAAAMVARGKALLGG